VGVVLVLTRKSRQSIMIGDDIEVTVLSNDGTKVRLGIQAPQAIPVHRAEIYDQIHVEHQEDATAHGIGR
jgi:carbon storage regulator